MAATLVINLNLTKFTTENRSKRFGLFDQSIGYVLNHRELAGSVWEFFVGHCTHFGLVNRDLSLSGIAVTLSLQHVTIEPIEFGRASRGSLLLFVVR